MLKAIRTYALTLALFAAGATALLSLVQMQTAPLIQLREDEQRQKLLDELLPPALYDNDLLHSCYLAMDPLLGAHGPHHLYLAKRQGVIIAVVVESNTPGGYGGPIRLITANDLQGTILGVRVLGHHETPGIGDKIERRNTDWIEIFTGRKFATPGATSWQISRDGGNFDQISGATITSRAVVNGVQNAARYVLKERHMLKIEQRFENLPRCEVTR